MVTRECGEHILRYVHVESLCCTPETNTILYANYNKKDCFFKEKSHTWVWCTHFRGLFPLLSASEVLPHRFHGLRTAFILSISSKFHVSNIG